jgi:hypothetical protein
VGELACAAANATVSTLAPLLAVLVTRLQVRPRFSQLFGGPDYDSGMALTVDPLGGVYLTGYVSGDVDFGGGVIPASGQRDIFVLKLSP